MQTMDFIPPWGLKIAWTKYGDRYRHQTCRGVVMPTDTEEFS